MIVENCENGAEFTDENSAQLVQCKDRSPEIQLNFGCFLKDLTGYLVLFSSGEKSTIVPILFVI